MAPGDVPLNLVIAANRYVITSNSGYGRHYLQSYDENLGKVSDRMDFHSLWYGLAYDAGHELLLASSGAGEVYVVPFHEGRFGTKREVPLQGCGVTSGIAGQDNGAAVVACDQSHEIRRFDFINGKELGHAPTGEFPYAVRVLPGGRLAVSNWGQSSVSVFDGNNLRELARIPVGSHPNDMLLLPEQKRLVVACSDSDSVSFIDLDSLREVRRIDLSVPGKGLSGVQPDALAYDAAAHRLYVGLATIDAVAVIRVGDDIAFGGLFPAGRYPAAMQISPNSGTLYIANGRNPKTGPNRLNEPHSKAYRYIGHLLGGGVNAISRHDLRKLGAKPMTMAQQVYGRAPRRESPEATRLIRRLSGPSSPIQHVIYVIKENRTYDQVFGDLKEGNGDPDLTLFGEQVTPNHHALAREFILFDNFFVDGYVSAEGHLWSTAGAVTDYVAKFWPSTYSDRAKEALESPYDGDEKHDHPISVPGSGFLWDRAWQAAISYRNYGEWNVSDPANAPVDRNYLAGLKDHFDPKYLDAIGDVTDQSRIDEFEREFHQFEKNGDLPRLIILHLPNDHTMGTRADSATPIAMVADNDLALGRLVEIVSKSRFWPRTAIFVLEDDAQDGPDHVDARRSVMLAISPYTRRKAVSHAEYSTVSVLHTIVQILGLSSMTYFDDRAASVLPEFLATPQTGPYHCRPAQVNLHEKNGPEAPGAKDAAKWDFSHPDLIPDDALNRVVWQSVKGAGSEPPATLTRIAR
ncbi:MAG: bifunctional YncE family protein/alkaline phosphatase family protein [Bryobacteraceae bacterium]